MKELIIGFDADDTLWVNEPYFRDTEQAFCQLLVDYSEPQHTEQTLIVEEMKNLERYGYGIKGFMISMIETALQVSKHTVSANKIANIIALGNSMLDHEVELLDGVKEVLEALKLRDYKMVVVTKGDLLDQKRKLQRSGLSPFFHHVEVLSDKTPANYLQLLQTLDIDPAHFIMVGNSLKSDIIPLISIGARAVYIPFHTTWVHEEISEQDDCPDQYTQLEDISGLLELLK